MTQTWAQVQRTFQAVWGYTDFRPPQDQIIRSLLSGQDALIILPTGGGKSLCFQLPAILRSGLTLVVSPLIALMENQVQDLQTRGLPAQLIHSQLSKFERYQTLNALENNQVRLLYLSPETLLSLPVWEKLIQPNLQINGLILDEAHCLVQWGDTFRPAYRRLGAVRPALLKHKPKGSKMAIAAFTATADPQAQRVITQTLQLKSPKKFSQSPYRPNLNLAHRTIWTPKGKRAQMRKFIQAQATQSGLIYVRSRREAEVLTGELTQANYVTAPYHGGLSPGDRRQREKDWLTGKLQFVVCTNAFGMGIDKADVRWVLHYHSPSLLAEYIQEIGRAGRDGKTSIALSLVAEPSGWLNPEDNARIQFFRRTLQKNIRQAAKFAQHLPAMGNIRELDQPQAELSLAILHSTGQLQWRDPFIYVRQPQSNPKVFHKLMRVQTEALQEVRQFWATKTCRWRSLLQSFGFFDQAQNFRCGHCDRCQKSS
ncbi:RecQ family ATP-dependent DNA helicase [Synechococcus moorigangaii CMS01]|nr:RecQ family ATP-dependent DNA helicase [Synechococcus moorigangaii CMS01]